MAEKAGLKDIIGEELLNKIQNSYLEYLESSAAIYELNGDYATAIFTSKYCDFLNQASRKAAGKTDEEALKSGKWICHEDCWATSLKSINDKKPCETECSGGIKILAVPIIAEGMVIGSNNAGCSNPPTDEKKIKEIAERYKVDPKELLKIVKEYVPRPERVLNAVKNHILVAADTIADIFLRKEAEETLIEERNRLETITDNIGVGVALISKDYRTIWANNVLRQMYGEVEGKICYSTYNQQSDVCSWCGVRKVFETGEDKVITESVGKDKQGNTIWCEIFVTSVKNGSGDIIAALEVLIPITERKQTEKKFKQKMHDLEIFHKSAVDRELKMVELKKRVKELEEKLGEKS